MAKDRSTIGIISILLKPVMAKTIIEKLNDVTRKLVVLKNDFDLSNFKPFYYYLDGYTLSIFFHATRI